MSQSQIPTKDVVNSMPAVEILVHRVMGQGLMGLRCLVCLLLLGRGSWCWGERRCCRWERVKGRQCRVCRWKNNTQLLSTLCEAWYCCSRSSGNLYAGTDCVMVQRWWQDASILAFGKVEYIDSLARDSQGYVEIFRSPTYHIAPVSVSTIPVTICPKLED